MSKEPPLRETILNQKMLLGESFFLFLFLVSVFPYRRSLEGADDKASRTR